MTDTNHLQAMLANLQSQIAAVSSIAGNMHMQQSLPALTPVPQAVNIPALQQLINPAVQPQTPNTPNEQLVHLIRSVIASEMRTISPSQLPPVDITPIPEAVPALAAPQTISSPQPESQPQLVLPPPQPTVEQPPMIPSSASALLPLIGAAFSKEQQLWISQSANLLALPGFLTSPEGKTMLVQNLEAYQRYMAGSPK